MSDSVETEGSAPVAQQGSGPDADTAPESLPIDRAAALAEGAPGIPSRFIWWVLGVVLVVALAGLIGERVLTTVGLNPSTATTTTAPNPVRTSPADTPAPPAASHSLDAPLASFMGLSTPGSQHAAPFTLTDQHGVLVSLPSPSARVVVLTFFNAPCNDICPVLASELAQADADLGTLAADVEFVTVNTDPAALASSAEAPAAGTALGALPNWHMVTGPLATLDSLWKADGISISLDPKTRVAVHNDVMDFVDQEGLVRYRATPFADESTSGAFSLSAPSEARWAQGIASYAGKVAGQ